MSNVCAAGNTGPGLFDRELERQRLAMKIDLLASTLAHRVSVLPAVRAVRQCGFIVGVELALDDPDGNLGQWVVLAAQRRGAHISARGDLILLMPSLSSSESELRRLVAILASSIAEVAIGRMPADTGQTVPAAA